MLCPSVTCAVHSANRTHRAGHVEFHTRVRVENPSSPNPATSLAFVRPRDQLHPPLAFPDRVSLPQPARGGLMRCTARTARSLLCQPGTVPIKTTAATRPLSLICRSRRLLSPHTHLRVTMPRLLSIKFTPGDAAACSCMPTDISLTHSDLTHAVFLTHSRSLTHRASLTHTTPLTPAGALTRGVSPTHRASLTYTGALTHGAVG